MNARVLVLVSVHALLVYGVTVNLESDTPEIISKTKVELTPILIESVLNDIVVLSAPFVNAYAVYYLHKPNGNALRLNFEVNKDAQDPNETLVKNLRHKIFNTNNASCCANTDVFATEEAKMAKYDFMIGPLLEEDHGNWMLSAYLKDIDGQWVELFQVITIEITEIVPLYPEKMTLRIGDTYTLSFGYPSTDLGSCQIEPPASTVDRYYEGTKTGLNKCEFIMNNVTLADDGTWTIIGVGRIVYKGTASLRILDVNKYDK